ncbi:hypothetical protein FGB62_30g344 [Gracilaria domingensis]|nr:hypothetical protein FGB62_30g344 [Gracilaria domingensis]
MPTPAVPGYRQSYIEKDRCVRNSTAVKIPGVDVMQGFTLSKAEFEDLFLQTAENVDDANHTRPANRQKPARFRRKPQRRSPDPSDIDSDSDPSFRPFRGAAKLMDPNINSAEEAAHYADLCRKHAGSLQRCIPPDYDGAGEFFEKAVDARAKFGLFCTSDNADAHVEYAQNLSKRGLTPEAEYHLRSAADIYRMMDARSARKYGDVLLYMAVVIDRQGRLAEAENFYRSALAVYRKNKLSDDNVRVAIDGLSNNLRAQERPDEVDAVVKRHFLGALD